MARERGFGDDVDELIIFIERPGDVHANDADAILCGGAGGIEPSSPLQTRKSFILRLDKKIQKRQKRRSEVHAGYTDVMVICRHPWAGAF